MCSQVNIIESVMKNIVTFQEHRHGYTAGVAVLRNGWFLSPKEQIVIQRHSQLLKLDGCYRCLVIRGLGCCETSYSTQDRLPGRELSGPHVRVLRLRNSGLADESELGRNQSHGGQQRSAPKSLLALVTIWISFCAYWGAIGEFQSM